MLDDILNFIKKFIPRAIFQALQPAYHFTLGWLAALWYGKPSNKMTVVGVTGTTGKTTTVFLLAEILKSAGLRTGYITTAMFSDGEKEWLNDKKMTMVGRFFTQKLLSRMVKNECGAAIIETTSQGITQFRHQFINYDILVFTGLYPEHIEAHGGFENYKKAKGKLFAHLKNCRKKKINGKFINKTTIVNGDDKHKDYFLNFWAERKILFSCHSELDSESNVIPAQAGIQKDLLDSGSEAGMAGLIRAENINYVTQDLQFAVEGVNFQTHLLGDFNITNSLAAISAARAIGIPMEKIKAGLEKVKGIPGRLEKISNDRNFTIIVDYAFEPNAAAKLYETVKKIPHNKVIHVLGSCGGGRDRSRRPKLGKLAGENADYVIITNEDPYDEDPVNIINEVFAGVVEQKISNFQFPISNKISNLKSQISNESQIQDLNIQNTKHQIRNTKTENINAFRILDRREAIKKALSLAQENDIILVTGKGSEQAICVADGKKIPWDDRKIIRELLQELSSE